MASYDFDLFTLGGGSGGVAASRRAASYGARVALAEDDRLGGTCVVRGCVPKKLLVQGSHYRDEMEDARGFGWSHEPPRFHWDALRDAKDAEVTRLTEIYGRLLEEAGVRIMRGRARIVDAHTVEVLGARYTAKNILVATGGKPIVPKVPGASLGITSNEALSLPTLPSRMAVVGGGYIGVELAGVFHALGVDVTVLLRGDDLLRGFDDDIRAALGIELEKRGIVLRRQCVLRAVEKQAQGLRVQFEEGESLDTDVVLFATGRAPNTSDLGLDDAGVTTDALGAVIVDSLSRTVVPSIFAVGDCTNRKNLTPVAIAEGRAVAETLFHDRPTTVEHATVPSAVFSQPPIGVVGLSEADARAKHGAVTVFVTSFRPLKHALSGRSTRTTMKVVVHTESDRVLGIHMVGEDAPEILQGFAVAMRVGITKADLDATVGIHPTAAEELVTLRTPRA